MNAMICSSPGFSVIKKLYIFIKFQPTRKLHLVTPEVEKKNTVSTITFLPGDDRSKWLAKNFVPLILFGIVILLR